MTAVLPAVLAGAAALVAVGLPLPRRHVGSVRHRTLGAPPAWVGALVVAGLLVLPAGPVGAAVAGLLAFLGQRALAGRAAGRSRDSERSAAAEAMAALAAELRAGRPPAVALAQAATVAEGGTARALREAASTTGLGGAAADVLTRAAEDSVAPDLLLGLAVCWQVCSGAGSSLAVAVDRLEQGLRSERLQKEEVEAELAGPRATAAVLAVLPAVGILMGMGLGARPLHLLLHTSVGRICLIVGVLLDMAGVWWTARIVSAAGGRS